MLANGKPDRALSMLGGKDLDVVVLALELAPRRQLVDLDGKSVTLDTELDSSAQQLLRAVRAVETQRLRASLESQRPDQADDAQEMIGVKMGKENLGERKADPVLHH